MLDGTILILFFGVLLLLVLFAIRSMSIGRLYCKDCGKSWNSSEVLRGILDIAFCPWCQSTSMERQGLLWNTELN